MLYEAMQDWRVYGAQSTIPLPKSGYASDEQREKGKMSPGVGNALFLLTKNREKSIGMLSDHEMMPYQVAMYRVFTSDTAFKETIGTKRIMRNELTSTKRELSRLEKCPMRFTVSLAPTLKAHKNIVVDMGRWMEIYFSQPQVQRGSLKQICERFADFISNRINDQKWGGYHKTLLIEIEQWLTDGGKQCIVMNKKLMNNPLSIIMYTACYFPELIARYGDITLYIISRADKQVLRIPMKDLIKKEQKNILKARIKMFKKIQLSSDEDDTEISTDEIEAEVVNDVKTKIYNEVKRGLLGGVSPTQNDTSLQDGTGDSDIDNVYDVARELDEIDSENEDDLPDELSEAIQSEIESFFSGDDEEELTDQEIADRIKTKVAKKAVSQFMPERTPEEEAKIERLSAASSKVVKPVNLKDLKSKVIEMEDFAGFIQTTNPNIKQSKFVNFDRDYVQKKFNDDIDNAVAALSKTDYPIFIIGKEEIDSSDAMNIKKTLVYRMEDAKGNKSTIKFDVPIIIDDKYIYINGSRKIIGHQFVLRPLVKTSPDVVQLVSWYNKVFLYRMGQEDSNTNMVRVYLEKNIDKFHVRTGSAIMKNKNYETPLDFDALSKTIYSFEIGDKVFIMEIDALLREYQSLFKKKPEYDNLHTVPVGIDKKTKSLICLNHGESFIKYLCECFDPEDKAAIGKIKRKPRLLTVKAKMMKHFFPIVLFMCYCVGFTEVTKRADIQWTFISDDEIEKLDTFDPLVWSMIDLEDGTLVWNKTSAVSSLIMNALLKEPMELYSMADLDDKDTWRYLINRYIKSGSVDTSLDNYKDFLMDPASQEMLSDMGYPTNLIDLLIVAIKLLTDNKYKTENNMANMRIRSCEVVPNIVYSLVTSAYNNYRKTAYKNKPTQISIKQNAVIDMLLDGETTNLVADASSLNPVLELEKGRAVTFKGLRGIQMDRAMTLPRRGFDESMLGVCGISTSPKCVGA